jgi:addiction module HigA family antidote
MAATQAQCSHPGSFVRASIIPAGMTVKDAAKRLGIGRPALSNFLNGKAALSTEMAVRLEKAFGADRKRLLEMQAAFDRKEQESGERNVAVRAFVPSFLTIKASQIEQWASSQIDARSRLPVLLRKLVHTTGNDLRQVDFPGYDNAQRKGSDGYVEAAAATPWVPEGKSYWEFGTDQRPGIKAESDYKERLRSIDPSERATSTFVFVTPRKWSGKTAWEKHKNASGDWKAVRAFDASDLEQWLEQSVPAQIWLAEQLALPVSGFKTLEEAWRRWASASEPSLTPEIFASSIEAYGDDFKAWLGKPSERHFVVAADSKDEAIAFIACLFDNGDLRQFKDRAAVFTSPATLRMLVSSSVPFIPIVHSEDTERELAGAHRRLHCIVFRPRNAVDTEADIALDLLGYEAFRTALTAMGIDEGEFDQFSTKTGRSPTILRRLLSTNSAISTPAWARGDDTERTLVPMALIGTWHAETEADREILSYVAERKYETIEVDVARLLGYDDCPVWSVGRYRGVASKRDALFAIAQTITQPDLERFFDAAEYVLSESDPALELSEKDRWAAVLYGKKRDHSGALREGICETLVILSVHGNDLFQHRLGIDVENRVGVLIRKLMTPLTLESLLSQDRDLPRYAEAAPEEFLRVIEEDLQLINPVVFGLLKPVESGSFWVSPSRTGLLWALECLAWKAKNLPRVTRILAQLSRPKIDDNLLNKPTNTLGSIFRSWMPQTAATVEQRIKALELLERGFPDVAWQIALEQIKPGSRIGTYNYRPRWRSDASGAGRGVTRKEMYEFSMKALDMLIAWPAHDVMTLGDLVESLQVIPEEDQTKVWDLINQWAATADEVRKAELRERIRRYSFTRSGRKRELAAKSRDRAREAYVTLQPLDPVIRHAWLFANQWVQESTDEIDDEDFDYRKRYERIDRLRREAMQEIWSNRGFDGVRECLIGSTSASTVGSYAATCIPGEQQRIIFIESCLFLDGIVRNKSESCVHGFLSSVGVEERTSVLRGAAVGLSVGEQIRLFACAPFQLSTWRLLDEYKEDVRNGYWKIVIPTWGPHMPAELTEMIDRLLEAMRPRAAFHAVHIDFADIETSRLKRLLRDVATVNAEPTGHFRLESYDISKALDSLQGRAGVTRDDMAQLEFLFIESLDRSEHGIPNLESQIAESPAIFVQAVALAFKRSDAGEDPPEWRIEDPEQKVAIARAAHALLDQMKKIPGMNQTGEIDASELRSWTKSVRSLCRKHARADIGDQCLGQLFARAHGSDNSDWPCEAVCQVMEEEAAPEIAKGFEIGVHNSRGIVCRGEGGDQERELVIKYQALAETLRFIFPYVASLFDSIASGYSQEACWWDSQSAIEKRLRR